MTVLQSVKLKLNNDQIQKIFYQLAYAQKVYAFDSAVLATESLLELNHILVSEKNLGRLRRIDSFGVDF